MISLWPRNVLESVTLPSPMTNGPPPALTFVSKVVALIVRSIVHGAAISGSNGESRRKITETVDPFENQFPGHPHQAAPIGGGLDGIITKVNRWISIHGRDRKA